MFLTMGFNFYSVGHNVVEDTNSDSERSVSEMIM